MGEIDLQSKFRSLSEVVREVLLQFESDPSFIQENFHLFEIVLATGKIGIDRLEQSVESTTLLSQAFLNWVVEHRQSHSPTLPEGLTVTAVELQGDNPVSFQQETVDVDIQEPSFSSQQDMLVAITSYGEPVEFSLDNVLEDVAQSPQDNQPVTCTICFKEFMDESKLKKHMSLSHASAKLHKCRSCGERFPSLRALKMHFRKQHHGCSQKEDLNIYLAEDELDLQSQQEELQQCQEIWQQNLVCSVCDKKFRTPRRLKYHQKIHQEVNPYKCPKCDKEFKVSKYLRDHVRTHSEDKPYVCKYCGRNFKSWGSRYCHYKVHRGNKKYSCEHCDKTFIRADGLKRHLIVHTRNKPFACTHCRKPFTLKNSLLAHIEKYHKGALKNGEAPPTDSNLMESQE